MPDDLMIREPQTLEAYLRVLRDTRPAAFLLENVAGLAYQRKDEGLELLRQTIKSINEESGTNYSFSVGLLNAVDFGVPQLRERVFIIGHREGREFEFPQPTHQRPSNGNGARQLTLETAELEPFMSAWDAIGDLEGR